MANRLRRCHECNYPLGTKDVFCPRCGASQRRDVEPARKYSFEELLAQHKALGLEPDREWLESPALPNEQAYA